MTRHTVGILGATGSIGTQALDVIRQHPDRFCAELLSAHASSDALFALAREFRPRFASLDVEPEEIPDDLKGIEWFFGENSAVRALLAAQPDYALCAIVGIAGLDAVMAALDVSQRVLLANKEALVTGGSLVMEKARRLGKALLPVDSEHSAIFQALRAADGNAVSALHLTASGGSLRDWAAEDIEQASVSDVLRHPTWRMGKKITVDCATMVNKGLEVMEAHHLFSMPPDKIHVVIHPESVIHSMVEYEDGALIAQMGTPDMRGPISYALAFPERIPYGGDRLDFRTLGSVSFRKPDLSRYPALGIAYEVLRAGGSAPVILNGANEYAVGEFLAGHIPFGAISRIIARTLDRIPPRPIRSIEDVHRIDAESRAAAESVARKEQN